MNNCCFKNDDNQNEILLMQIKREIEELKKETTAKLLMQDGKIAETCVYIKNNLSNELRTLLDAMDHSGELDNIITTTVLSAIEILQKQTEYEIDPDHSRNYTDDFDKLQEAVDAACQMASNGVKCVVKLNRVYDITGHSIVVNKQVNREKLIFAGQSGGIRKDDAGDMFTKGDVSYVTDIEFCGVSLLSVDGARTVVLRSPGFINVTFDNCNIMNVDTMIESDTYMQNINVRSCLITGGKGDLFKAAGFYGLRVYESTIEHRAGYVVRQKDVADSVTQYNKAFFIDISNNLIEGFSSGGIAQLYKVVKVNINENYFENMVNNIEYNGATTAGTISVCDNRLFIGTSQLETYKGRGLLNIVMSKYPTIKICGNRVENCYLFYIEKEYCNSTKIVSNGNSVTNTNTADGHTENGNVSSLETNRFPLIQQASTNNLNRWARTVVLVSDKEYRSPKIQQDNADLYVSIFNGIIKASVRATANIPAGRSTLNVYYGLPVYGDDIIITSVYDQGVDVCNTMRAGSGNDKYAQVRLHNTATTTKSNVTVMSEAIFNMSFRG